MVADLEQPPPPIFKICGSTPESVVVKMEHLLSIFLHQYPTLRSRGKILKICFMNIAGDRSWVRQARWVHTLDRSIGQSPSF